MVICFLAFLPFPKQALVFMCLQYKSLENTVGKGEIARREQFLLFPQCFLPIWRAFCHFQQNLNSCLQTLSVWKSLKLDIWERVKPVLTLLSFQSHRLLWKENAFEKYCGKGRINLVTSILPRTFHVFLPPINDRIIIWLLLCQLHMVSNLATSKVSLYGKEFNSTRGRVAKNNSISIFVKI